PPRRVRPRVARVAHRSRADRRALGRSRPAESARCNAVTRGIGLYVHIPFCASRCPYCDFATAPATTALRSRYLEALRREIAREGHLLGRPRVRTLFFGGGTPSLLEPAEIVMLGDALRDAFVLRPREVTLEANPATLDRARLAAWPALGRWRVAAAAAQPGDAGLARMYRLAERMLARAGYRHYEIANWARRGKRCLHNLGYWRDRDWLGVGAGAHTHLAGARSANPSELRAYILRANSGSERVVDAEADPPSEAAMLALRLDSGLDLGRYAARFGVAATTRVRSALREVESAHLVRVEDRHARLTARGRLLANE